MTPATQAVKTLLDALPSEERAELLATCRPEQPARPRSLRLLRPVEAARAMGVSATTCWRLRKEGRLPVVRVRKNSVRIPEDAVQAFVEGKL